MPYYKISNFSVWNYLPKVTLPNEKHLISFIKKFGNESIILDIGSGGRIITEKIITVDKFYTANTKVIADIHFLPFRDNSINLIICTGTMEHIENPWIAVREFKRVLKNDGYCYVSVPFMQGYHPDPSDYWRFTMEGLKILFKDFYIEEAGVLMGSGSGLSWAINDFFRSFSDKRFVSELLGVIARFLFFYVKYFDLILRKKQNNKLFASGYYIIARKN